MNEEWPLAGDPDGMIGKRHHYVPRFYLARFADDKGRVRRIERASGKSLVTHIKNCATERDFNTFINADGALDGRFEQLLSKVEHEGASAIRELCSPLVRFPVREETRMALCLLVAFQRVRGRKTRRTMEAMANLITRVRFRGVGEEGVRKLMLSRGQPAGESEIRETKQFINDLDSYDVASDPNEHIQAAGDTALRMAEELLTRSLYLAEFREPLLFTSDEPVSFFSKESGYAGGLSAASEVWLLIDPRRVLILMSENDALFSERRFFAESETSKTINRLTAYDSYEHVYAHPDFDVESFEIPETAPLFVADGAEAYTADVRGSRTVRRRHDDGKRRVR